MSASRLLLPLAVAGIFLAWPQPRALAAVADEHFSRGLKLYLDGEYSASKAEVERALAEDSQHRQAKRLLELIQQAQKKSKSVPGVLSQVGEAIKLQQEEDRRLREMFNAAVSGLQAQLDAAQVQSQEMRDRATKELEQAHSETHGLRERLSQASGSVEALERERAGLVDQLTQERDALTGAKTEGGQLKVKQHELVDQLAQATKAIERLDQERASLADQLRQTRDALTGAKTEIGQLKVKRNEVETLQRNLSKAEREAAQLADDRRRLTDEMTGLRQQLTGSQGRVAALQDAVANEQKGQAKLREELEAARRLQTESDQRIAELQRIPQALKEELAARERSAGLLQNELAQRAKRIEDLDAQLTKLQQIHALLDQQYAALSADYKAEGARSQEKLKALEGANRLFEDQLATMTGKATGFEGNLAEIRRANRALDEQLQERDLHLAKAQKRITDLEQTLEAKNAELDQATKGLSEKQQNQVTLEGQLHVAKETQTTLKEQLKELQAITEDREHLRTTLSEREAELAKVKAEADNLKRDNELAERHVRLAEAGGAERNEQARIERQALEWRVESLERELKQVRESEAKLHVDAEAHSDIDQEGRKFREQLAKKLSEREDQLRQAESMIRFLQGTAGISPPSGPAGAAASGSGAGASGSSTTSAAGGSVAPPLSEDQLIKIYDVNKELDFLVFSIKGTDWAQAGAKLLLVDRDKPVATIELTELDSAGFAVGQILETADGAKQIRKGDLLSARPLISPVGQ